MSLRVNLNSPLKSSVRFNLNEDKPAEQKFIEDYKTRYIELAKPISGGLAVVLYTLSNELIHDPDRRLKASTQLATLACWVLGEYIVHPMCVYFNLYCKPHEKNPLYRNLKTLTSVGSAVGILLASQSHLAPNEKLSFSLYSLLMGSVLAVPALILRAVNYQRDIHIDELVGTEGWSKYAKTAFVFGGSLGQFLAAINSLLIPKDLDNSFLYSATLSICGFVLVVIAVPLINYLTRTTNKTKGRGLFVTEDRDVFNTNYLRSGMTLGVALGTVLGGFLGPLILARNTYLAIPLGASFCSIILGISFAIYGQKFSTYLTNSWGIARNTDNSWSYATRSLSYFLSSFGILFTSVLCPSATATQAAIIGAAIAGLIGWFAGLLVIWLARKIEPEEAKMTATTLPWTQRLSTGATRGAIIGAAIGLVIENLGLGSWSIFLGALSSIIGGIKETATDPVFKKVVDKATTSLLHSKKPRKTKHSIANNELKQNRYALFFPSNNPLIRYSQMLEILPKARQA